VRAGVSAAGLTAANSKQVINNVVLCMPGLCRSCLTPACTNA